MERGRGLARGRVDRAKRPWDGRDGLEGQTDADGLAVGHSSLDSSGPIGQSPEGSLADDLVVCDAPAASGAGEAVADLHAFDRLDRHRRGGEPGVEPAHGRRVRAEPLGNSVDEHFDDAAEGVAVFFRLVDLRDHRGLHCGVEASDGARVEGLCGVGARRGALVHGLSDPHDSGKDGHSRDLAVDGRGDRAEGDACGRLAGGGAFEHGPGVVEAVLVHSHEVRVPGPRLRQGFVSRDFAGVSRARVPGQLGGVDGVGGHHRAPLRPFGVAYLEGYGRADRPAVADPREDGQFVALELLPGAAPVPLPPPGERARNVRGGNAHPCRSAFHECDEGRSVGLPRR